MAEMSKETEQKISQLQLYEQSLQNILMQKQQFQSQSMEVDSALSELENTKEAYKIVGNIMVASKKEDLKKELESKKETLNLRIKTFEKQEDHIREKAKKIQQEVSEKIKE
ncbi:MAG: prefoldin subunit beta [Nanoarchaeota archaeon]|nr:prefoldin subunit beta [Nanoarchaeota archaeon]MBU1005532.1 prefoldin subunit beta [Nanoarchaeota archaeon]MBU1946591.1 prefoldin subunit beta [Nanoarchaeota archaeon]